MGRLRLIELRWSDRWVHGDLLESCPPSGEVASLMHAYRVEESALRGGRDAFSGDVSFWWVETGTRLRMTLDVQKTSSMVHSKLKEVVMYGGILSREVDTRYQDDLCSLRVSLSALGAWLGVAIVKHRAGLL